MKALVFGAVPDPPPPRPPADAPRLVRHLATTPMDLIDVPDEVKREMEILSVKRMDEVLAIALKDPPPSILDLAKAAQAENHPTA